MKNLINKITQISATKHGGSANHYGGKKQITQIKTLKYCVIVLVLLTGIVGLPQDCFAWTISGTVYERDGVSLLKGDAKVTINDGTQDIKSIWNVGGMYTFSDIPNGTYIVKINGYGRYAFTYDSQNVTVADNDVSDVNFYRKNQPLVLNVPSSVTIEEGEYYKIHIFDHDADIDEFFTFECINDPLGHIFGDGESTATFEWIPDYNQAGTYEITFTGKENTSWGDTVSANMTITVLDNPEGQKVEITSSIYSDYTTPASSGPAPLWVNFGMKNIPSQAIYYVMNYHSHDTIWWKFGDKGMAQWPQPRQIFPEPGNYPVKLKITDNSQNILAQAETVIQVDPEPLPDRTFYLSPDGDDNNPGTETQPWKTLEKVWQLRPGDTLKLKNGVYQAGQYSRVENQHGNPNKWITIEAVDGALPVIDGSSNYFTVYASDYVKIRNLEFRDKVIYNGWSNYLVIDGCKFTNFSSGFMTGENMKGFVVRNCEFRQSIVGGNYGSFRGDGLLFENNTFYWEAGATEAGCMFKGSHTANAEIRYNKFIALNGSLTSALYIGGQFSGGDYTRWNSVYFNIHDNIFYDWAGTILTFFDAKDVIVYHNTIYSPNRLPLIIYLSDHSYFWEHHYSEYITIKNNIFYTGSSTNARLLQIDQNCPAKGFISDNNIWYASGSAVKVYWRGATKTFAQYVTDTGNDLNSVVVDPLFVNPANNDLHLSQNSPAIDAGADFLLAPIDFDNILRPQGVAVDIGAYEYVGPTSTLPGDFDGDNDVDIKDLILVAKDYGVKYNISHIILVAQHYGEKL